MTTAMQMNTFSQQPKKFDTRTIKCPVCEKGLFYASKNVSYKNIRTYPPPTYDGAVYFVKCQRCRKQIGVSIPK